MSRIGLVLEGGSFRGIFTAGVLDSLLEHHISFPYVIGVSAGSGNAVNFIAGQEGRTKKVITHENADAYYGLGTLRNNGKVLDLDQMLAYDKEPLNFDSFFASKVEREFVARRARQSISQMTELRRAFYRYVRHHVPCRLCVRRSRLAARHISTEALWIRFLMRVHLSEAVTRWLLSRQERRGKLLPIIQR